MGMPETKSSGRSLASTMKIDIDALSESELVDLNHRIVERLRFINQMRAHRDMLEFGIGDRVGSSPIAAAASKAWSRAITRKRSRL